MLLIAVPSAASGQSRHPLETENPLGPIEETPVQSPIQLPEWVAPTEASVEPGDGPVIRQVRVLAEYAGSSAVPPERWRPPAGPSAAVRLEHRAGQSLDIDWVRTQIDRNVPGGGIRPSTAIALVQLINRAFLTAGFVNSGLLVQRVDLHSGTIDLNLVYGRLTSSDASVPPVTIEWDGGRTRGLGEGYIRGRYPSSRARPLNAFEIERDFRLLDEDPNIRSISAALRPGAAPGQASLHLLVNAANRYDTYVGASNDRSPAVGGDRLFAGGSIRSFVVSGDILSIEGGMTRGVNDAQLSYVVPILSPQVSLTVRGDFNNAAVISQPLELLDIKAKDRGGEAGINYYLRRAPLMPAGQRGKWKASETLSTGIFFTYRTQKSFLLGEPFSFAPGSVNGRARFSAMRLAGDYVRRDLKRVIAASLSSTIGLDGTRSDIPSVPNPDRHFVALLAQLNYVQRLGSDFEFRSRLIAQFSTSTLYSATRLGIGGAQTVRGYRESLFLTDRGIIGTVELARPFSLSGRSGANGVDWGRFTVSAFADAARFANARQPQPETKSIASVGVSLAWTPTNAFEALVSYGHALKHVGVFNGNTVQDKGVHFRVIAYPLRFGL